MADIFSDHDIELLLKEIKPLPEDYRSKIQIRPKRGHKERELDVQGVNGSDFRLILRQSLINPIDFSVILAYRHQTRINSFVCGGITGKAMNIRIPLRKKHFTTFIFIKPPSAIRRSAQEKTPMLWHRIDFPNSIRPLFVS